MSRIPILIVDDNHFSLLPLLELLENPDIEPLCAGSGTEAVAKCLDHEFALILWDVQMPGMNGRELVDHFQKQRKRMPPVIFISDTDAQLTELKCFGSTHFDYVFRPVVPELLLSKVGLFLDIHRERKLLDEITAELEAKTLEIEVLQNELEEKNQALELLSSLDGLTGLFNQRYFDDNLQKEWKHALRSSTSLALLIVDVDFFRKYIDSYGHSAGDECLRRIALALYEALLRPVDIIARYGGDKFAVILPATDAAGAEQVARRMMDNVAGLQLVHDVSTFAGMVTVTIGGAAVVPGKSQKSTVLIEAAAEFLNSAQKNGRNRYRIETFKVYQ